MAPNSDHVMIHLAQYNYCAICQRQVIACKYAETEQLKPPKWVTKWSKLGGNTNQTVVNTLISRIHLCSPSLSVSCVTCCILLKSTVYVLPRVVRVSSSSPLWYAASIILLSIQEYVCHSPLSSLHCHNPCSDFCCGLHSRASTENIPKNTVATFPV